MSIITSIPFPNFIDGVTVASGAQVNANNASLIAQVNANAAGNGVNSDITALTALASLPAGLIPQLFIGGLAGGTANALTLATVSPADYVLQAGASTRFFADATNTGPATLSVAGSAAENLLKLVDGAVVPLVAGDIYAGMPLDTIYDGVQHIILNIPYDPVTAAVVSAQARFQFTSSTVVSLLPRNGNLIAIAGVNYALPSGGISATISSCFVNGVAAQALSPTTLYYAYVFNNSGTLTIDFSTTGHSTDTAAGNIGIEIKTGDNTRSLIGMVYPLTGPVFASGAGNQLVVSWFQRRGLSANNHFTTSRTTQSTSYTEINSEIRCQFLTWSDETVQSAINGSFSSNQSSVTIQTALAFDSTTVASDFYTASTPYSTSAPIFVPLGISGYVSGLSEGFHYATLLGSISNAADTASWTGGATAGARTSLNVGVQG